MSAVSLDKSIWSQFILDHIVSNSPYISVANKSFQGDAEFGKNVIINTLTDFTSSDYTIGSDMVMTAQSYTSQSLAINQQKYIFRAIDRLYQRQWDVNFMEQVARKAGDVFAQAADTYLATLYSEVSGTATDLTAGGSGWTIGTNSETAASASAYNAITKMNTVLDENDTPQNGRWVIIPAWTKEKLILDTRFGAHVTYLQNGLIQGATVNGTNVYYSNNVSGGYLIAGGSDSLAFAAGLSTLQIIQPEKQVADALKALYAYGGKVIKATQLATLKAIEYS